MEELGGLAHPGWCSRPHTGAHRSEPFTVAGRTLRASAGPDWAVRIKESGGGPLTAAEAAYRAAVIDYLNDPACRRLPAPTGR